MLGQLATAVLDRLLAHLFALHPQARDRKVVVFYGSQTGTAEDFASRLAKEASKYGVTG